MIYRIYRLDFYSGVHFGSDFGSEHVSSMQSVFHSDSLFSALCQEALKLGGEPALQQLVNWSREGSLLLSDLFPYSGDTYFLPKPKKLYSRKETPVLPEGGLPDRKLVKKMTHISADLLDEYLAYQQGKTDRFDMESVVGRLHGIMQQERKTSAALRAAESEPYYVGMTQFAQGSGLYAIVGCEQPEQIDPLFRSLETTGIGGRKSYGLGKFVCEPVELHADAPHGLGALYRRLTAANPAVSMTLNTSLPRDEELDCLCDAQYLLIRRGGMKDGSAEQHKRTVYALEAGSCVSTRYAGQILDVRIETDGHPIYRNFIPMYLEVE